MAALGLTIRVATHADRGALESLIDRSSRQLGTDDYTPEQIEAALTGAWGVDTQLIADGTLFVATIDRNIVGCGAWSWRRTLFGSDSLADRDASPLDPRIDGAKIRVFFVDPAYARIGIGSRLLSRCEEEAKRHGFREIELGATIPGRRFYASRGYEAVSVYDFECAPGISVPVTVMKKRLKP